MNLIYGIKDKPGFGKVFEIGFIFHKIESRLFVGIVVGNFIWGEAVVKQEPYDFRQFLEAVF